MLTLVVNALASMVAWIPSIDSGPPAKGLGTSVSLNKRIDPVDGVLVCVAFSPDGKQLAVGGKRLVQTFDAASGKRIRQFAGHRTTVTCLAFSPDGTQLASGSKDRTIRLWNIRTGKTTAVLRGRIPLVGGKISSMLTRLVFFPDGKTLASCDGSNFVRLWDLNNGRWRLRVSVRHLKSSACVDVSRDGKSFAVAGTPNPSEVLANVSLYRVDFGLRRSCLISHGGETQALYVRFSPDGRRLFTCGRKTPAVVWNVKSGKQMMKFTGSAVATRVVAGEFSKDGAWILSATDNEVIQVWNSANGRLMLTVKGSDRGLRGFALSPNRKLLATCGEDGVVKLWAVKLPRQPVAGRKPKTRKSEQMP